MPVRVLCWTLNAGIRCEVRALATGLTRPLAGSCPWHGLARIPKALLNAEPNQIACHVIKLLTPATTEGFIDLNEALKLIAAVLR